MTKKKRVEIAFDFTQRLQREYREDINKCYNESYIFDNNIEDDLNKNKLGNVITVDMNTAKTAYQYTSGKTAIVSFASYDTPGGKYLEGVLGQEESLCSKSILYPVLFRYISEYYSPNSLRLNNFLYTDTGIYLKDVLFFKGDSTVRYDVISIAPPNVRKATNVAEEDIRKALYSRLLTIFKIANYNDVDNLILGAFGCDTYYNSPKDVRNMCKNILDSGYSNCFDNVVFAVPKSDKDSNHEIFAKLFK